MSLDRELFTKRAFDPEEFQKRQQNPFLIARDRILWILIQYTLIESYHIFLKEREPYPFVQPAMLKPGAVSTIREYTLHRSGLVTLIDGILPERLRKHFHVRSGNRVLKKNIVEVAPDLPELSAYSTASRKVSNKGFDALLRMLLPLDYTLLIQGLEENNVKEFHLTNFHVKIERIIDNAIRSLGIHLNYLERDLYEKGEIFIDALEKKFFEYYSFYHNAAGRRSAAALATQLLTREKLIGSVFINSQQDRRLTVLTTSGESQETHIEQYLLLLLPPEHLKALKIWGRRQNIDIIKHYQIAKYKFNSGVFLFRVRYQHTEAGSPTPDGTTRKNFSFRDKWIRLKDEAIIPIVMTETTEIGYQAVYRRNPADEPSMEKNVLFNSQNPVDNP
ncbi:MAG: hypothetical protein H7832_05410 [Magnetococcus sp. DMHC-6]